MSRDNPNNSESNQLPRLAYSLREAAESIGMPYQTLLDHIHRGEIAHTTYGKSRNKRRILIQVRDLHAWLDRRRVPAKWEPAPEEDADE